MSDARTPLGRRPSYARPLTVRQLMRKLKTLERDQGDIMVGVRVPSISSMAMPIQDVIVWEGKARCTLVGNLEGVEKWAKDLN